MCSKIKFILTINLQPVVGSAIQMYNHPPPVMILMIGNKFFATKNHCLCLGLFLLALLHCIAATDHPCLSEATTCNSLDPAAQFEFSVVDHCVLITPELIKFHSPDTVMMC